jgi:hypothetical protein
LFQLLASLKLCTSIDIAVFRAFLLVFFLSFSSPAMVSFAELADPNNPKVGSEFVRSLKFPDGLFAAPSIVPEEDGPKTPAEHSAFHRPNNNVAVLDNLFGSAALASWSERQDELIDQLFGTRDASSGLPSPAEVYYRYWKYPVTGVLMVAHVRRTKFSVSEPFLLSITFPTVLPRGYSGEVLSEPSPKARLMPGQGLLPDQGKMAFIGGVAQSLRKHSLKDNPTQPATLLADYVVGFGQKAFSHIVVPMKTIAPDSGENVFGNLSQPWEVLANESSGHLPSDILGYDQIEIEGDQAGGLRLPIMLPIIGPLGIPAGIVGHASLGQEALRTLLADGVGLQSEALAWLDHPLVSAWLAAAEKYREEMSVEVFGKPSLATSLQYYEPSESSDSIASFANPLVEDFWRVMESTLVFRYRLDTQIGPKKHGNKGSTLYEYLSTAANGLYHEHNILGARPVEVGYEILLLRPATSGSRRKGPAPFREFLAPWKFDAPFCPTFLRDYKVEAVVPAVFGTSWPLQ